MNGKTEHRGLGYAKAMTRNTKYGHRFTGGLHRGSHKLSSQVHTEHRKRKQAMQKASRKANRKG